MGAGCRERWTTPKKGSRVYSISYRAGNDRWVGRHDDSIGGLRLAGQKDLRVSGESEALTEELM